MAARRANGEGTKIRRRKDGRWTCQVRYIDPITGLPVRESLYGHKQSDVVDQLHALKQRIRRGDGPLERVGFRTFIMRWLSDVDKPANKSSTYALHEGIVRNHLVPIFGDRALHEIRPGAIAHHVTGEGSRMTPSVAKNALGILRNAFDVAIAWRLLERNPAIDVKPPRISREEIRPLAPDEVLVFLEAARRDPLYAVFLIAIFTQMREGEILALRAGDVDLQRHHLRVKRKLDARSRQFGDVKTHRSNRPIDISPEIEDALRPYVDGKRGDALVFTTSKRTPYSARNVVRSFKRILEAINKAERERSGDRNAVRISPKTRFHDLRHTGATLLLAAGVHPKIVQERLGHESVKTTLDTYSHYIPTLGAAAAEALRRFMPAHPMLLNGGQNGGQPADVGVAVAPSVN